MPTAPVRRRTRARSAAPTRPLLEGQIALVAGATRGAGRGIARALGEAGAIVYCTGRSVAGQPSPYQRPETIEETAALIAAAGGRAFAVAVDHTQEAAVDALVGRIEREQGRLDIVVDSVAGELPLMGQWGSFWTADVSHAQAIFRQALVPRIVTAKHAARVMVRQRGGLIVEITENDVLSAGGNPMAQSVKLSVKGLALNMAAELKPHGVMAVAVTPGFLRSEMMLEHHKVSEDTWRDAGAQDANFLESESPLYVGRGIAALAADPERMAYTGQLLSSWELARRYRVTDYDGRRPDWGRLAIDFSGLPPWLIELMRVGSALQIAWLTTLAARTRAFRAKIPAPAARSRRRPAPARRPSTRRRR